VPLISVIEKNESLSNILGVKDVASRSKIVELSIIV
jgi:hypothetical protein